MKTLLTIIVLQLFVVKCFANNGGGISDKKSTVAKKQEVKISSNENKPLILKPKNEKKSKSIVENRFKNKYLSYSVSCCLGCPTLRPCQ